MAFVVSRQRKIFYDLDGERGPYLLLYPSLWMDLQFWEEAGYLEGAAARVSCFENGSAWTGKK